MKAIALANRLKRDLNVKSLADLTADALQAIQDAINGAIQKLNERAPAHSKQTTASIYLEAPAAVSIGVTAGSIAITGAAFTADQYGRTIRIDGDAIDNQIAGSAELLHPYLGTTGTVSAVIYSDAVPLPEIYTELIGDPHILETGRDLINQKVDFRRTCTRRPVQEPQFYWSEANARNQNPTVPAVLRFDSLPNRAYRLTAEAIMAPLRVAISELLVAGPELPFRDEFIETYLMPLARAELTTSDLWKSDSSRLSVQRKSDQALADFPIFAPSVLSTPNNRVGTPPGF